MKRFLSSLLCLSLLAACSGDSGSNQTGSGTTTDDLPTSGVSIFPTVEADSIPFGQGVEYEEPSVAFHPQIAADFSTDALLNTAAIEKAYGFTLSATEKDFLNKNKFLLKDLLSTNIVPEESGGSAQWMREFAGLYERINGPFDYKARAPEHAVYYSSDVFMTIYTILFTELLKEMENTAFFPAMKELSKTFYEAAEEKMANASDDAEKQKWMKVRNYFAVPYTLLSTAKEPLKTDDFYNATGELQDPNAVQDSNAADDAKADTIETATAFVKGLKMDSESEKLVLEDLMKVFNASSAELSSILQPEYEAYVAQAGIKFKTDFTQFTPRSHYTGSSLRRQYFRAMTWYIQLPFFLRSSELTQYAFGITQLFAEHPEQLKEYSKLESMISFLVGTSDDLMPVDYMSAIRESKGKANQELEIMNYLKDARPPRIKSIPAEYQAVGEEQSANVLLATKGMRVFSGKFIIDSYWTGMLTQGDEAPRPGFTQKLPPMASSLEVMSLLGSDYASTQIPKLDFVSGENSQAIDQMMTQLREETEDLDQTYWTSNIYSIALWSVQSLFGWQKDHKAQLPRFMQSPLWDVKTLMTASGFWTEMRHATLLYAKQSFAELGGGGGACDTRPVPPPPMGYIEPLPQLYARLSYLAKRTEKGITEQGYQLSNIYALQNYIALMDTVRDISLRELNNDHFQEKVIDVTGPDPMGEPTPCTEHVIDGISDWETIRMLVQKLEDSLPRPVEGPILTAKDKRAALIADVHTGGDSSSPTRVLYEAIGVPKLILVAVSDGNGSRLTTGFTYSHYEFTQPYGGNRLTDEKWQSTFYNEGDTYSAYLYTDPSTWPAAPTWYDSILGK